jgi:hypothetical protein
MKTKKKKYRVNNWKKYNTSLINRGSINLWIDDDLEEKWYSKKSNKPGRQEIYSDFAIKTVLTLGKVFNQRLRQATGLVKSLFKQMNINLPVPDYSTLSRRAGKIKINIYTIPKGEVNFIIDSSGIKIYGEGEWKVRKHGYTKRRTWRKIHISIDSDGEIRTAELTNNNIADCHVVENLINQEKSKIKSIYADGAYDKENVYEVAKKKGIKDFKIPPQKNAKIKQHGNCKKEPHPRDENLRKIRKTTRKQWKINSGYHKRSLVENTMFRFKTINGDKLNLRKFENQKTEFLIGISILNKMFKNGMPISYSVE